VQKLTLNQAAKELGIKKDSVYKRVKRGTLPFTKESDGQVYVYIDNEKATDKASEEDEGTDIADGGPENKDRPWWDILAGVSGLVVVLGLMVYVLGLFTLWAPIVRTYTHNAVTAWYAVSLVPRPVVAGLGMRQLVAFPLLTTITILTLFFTFYYLFRVLSRVLRNRFGKPPSHETDEASGEKKKYLQRLQTGSFAAMPVYGLVLLYAGWLIAANFAPLLGVPQWRLALSLVFLLLCAFFAVTTILGGVITAFAAKKERRGWSLFIVFVIVTLFWCGLLITLFYITLPSIVKPSSLLQQLRTAEAAYITDAVIVSVAALFVAGIAPGGLFLFLRPLADRAQHQDNVADRRRPFRRRPFILVLASIIVPSFLAAFMLTFVSDPPLATVDIDGSRGVEGALLTHVDGYWYVFNPKGNLVAVPDDDVTDVNICSSTAGKATSLCLQRK
jgi:hypothetical protein